MAMNRAERRAQEKLVRSFRTKPLKHRRVGTNTPMLHEVNMVFGPVESFLAQLATGEVNALPSGEIIFSDYQGETYEAVPAVRGFAGALKRVCSHFNLTISDAPVVKLCNRLDACMPITPADVEAARVEVAKFREAYRKMDLVVVKGLVTTELIAIELEQRT